MGEGARGLVKGEKWKWRKGLEVLLKIISFPFRLFAFFPFPPSYIPWPSPHKNLSKSLLRNLAPHQLSPAGSGKTGNPKEGFPQAGEEHLKFPGALQQFLVLFFLPEDFPL